MFYDDSILSGTKTSVTESVTLTLFYDDSILSGTKTTSVISMSYSRFMMTQFFQVLKQMYKLFTNVFVL